MKHTNICLSYQLTVKLITEDNFEFIELTLGCTPPSTLFASFLGTRTKMKQKCLKRKKNLKKMHLQVIALPWYFTC